MFPLAHSNYRDISLFWKSTVSTQTFRHSAIFSKNDCIYIILKKYLLSKQFWNFFFLSKRRAVVPTHTQFNLCELFSRQPLFPTGLLSKFYFSSFSPPIRNIFNKFFFFNFLLISPFVIQQVPYWEFFSPCWCLLFCKNSWICVSFVCVFDIIYI